MATRHRIQLISKTAQADANEASLYISRIAGVTPEIASDWLSHLPHTLAAAAPTESAKTLVETFAKFGYKVHVSPSLEKPTITSVHQHSKAPLHATLQSNRTTESTMKPSPKLSPNSSILLIAGIALTFSLSLLLAYFVIAKKYGQEALDHPDSLDEKNNSQNAQYYLDRAEKRLKRLTQTATKKKWQGQSVARSWDETVESSPNYFRTKEARLVEADLKRALEIDPKHIDISISLGQLALEQGKIDLARHYFTEALSLNPNHPELYGWLGRTEWQGGQYLAAKDAFEKAYQLSPSTAEYSKTLGNLNLFYLQDSSHAMIWYQKYLSLPSAKDFERSAIKTELMALLWQKEFVRFYPAPLQFEDFEIRRKSFAEKLNQTNDYKVANQLGNLYIQQKKWREAKSLFEQSLRLEKKQVEGYEALAHVYAHAKNFSANASLYQRAHEASLLSPKMLYAYAQLSYWLLEDKKQANALAKEYESLGDPTYLNQIHFFMQ